MPKIKTRQVLLRAHWELIQLAKFLAFTESEYTHRIKSDGKHVLEISKENWEAINGQLPDYDNCHYANSIQIYVGYQQWEIVLLDLHEIAITEINRITQSATNTWMQKITQIQEQD